MNINCWMIYSKANNAFITTLQKCLYRYWELYDFEMDYFIFHIFSAMLFEDNPELLNQIPFLCQHASEYLQMQYNNMVDKNVLDSILLQTDVHKLNYKGVPQRVEENTYYEWIITRYK